MTKVGISVCACRFLCVFEFEFSCHHGYHIIDLVLDLEIMMGIRLDGWKEGPGNWNWNWNEYVATLVYFLGRFMKMILAVTCAWRCVLILAQIVEENKNKLTGWRAKQNNRR